MNHKQTTIDSYNSLLNNHVLPVFGKKRLDEITRKDIKDFVINKQNDGLAANTVRICRAYLSSVLTQAVDDEIIQVNPAASTGRYIMSFDFSIIERLYERHKMYGFNVPACDIDHLVVEYYYSVPFALIEYKSADTCRFSLIHPSFKAVKYLADAAVIPFFLVRYTDKIFDTWRISAVNLIAETKFKKLSNRAEITLNEEKFVRFLYWLRDIKAPNDLFCDGWNEPI